LTSKSSDTNCERICDSRQSSAFAARVRFQTTKATSLAFNFTLRRRSRIKSTAATGHCISRARATRTFVIPTLLSRRRRWSVLRVTLDREIYRTPIEDQQIARNRSPFRFLFSSMNLQRIFP